MNTDHLKSAAQRNQLEMLMMLQNMEEKLLPDYFAGGGAQADGLHHCYYPGYPDLASSLFVTPPSNNSKSSIISFTTSSSGDAADPEAEEDSYDRRALPVGVGPHNNMAAMREMIFRIAAMQPINIDPEAAKQPKRRNVRISSDPQSVAARHRRERISERIRILQRLVPGGTKMDTASMLDEAIHYVKFLKRQVQSLEKASHANDDGPGGIALGLGFPLPATVADPHGLTGYADNNGYHTAVSLGQGVSSSSSYSYQHPHLYR